LILNRKTSTSTAPITTAVVDFQMASYATLNSLLTGSPATLSGTRFQCSPTIQNQQETVRYNPIDFDVDFTIHTLLIFKKKLI